MKKRTEEEVMSDNLDDGQEVIDFGEESREPTEYVVVQIIPREDGSPEIFIDGNVDQDRAVFLLDAAHQIALEQATFLYLPGLDEDEEDEGEASEQ